MECFSGQLEALSSAPSIPQTGHGKAHLWSQHLSNGAKRIRSFTVWFGYIVRRWSAQNARWTNYIEKLVTKEAQLLITKWISPICNCRTIRKWQNSKSSKREISICLWFEGKEGCMNRGFLFRVQKLFFTAGVHLCTFVKSADGRASGVDSNINSDMLYHRNSWTTCSVELQYGEGCAHVRVSVYLFTSFWCGHKTALKISSIKQWENTFKKDLIIYVFKKQTHKWLLSHPVG